MDSVTSSAQTELRKTPLNALQPKLGAKMVNFGGWGYARRVSVERRPDGGTQAVRGSVGISTQPHGRHPIHTRKNPGGALAAVQHPA